MCFSEVGPSLGDSTHTQNAAPQHGVIAFVDWDADPWLLYGRLYSYFEFCKHPSETFHYFKQPVVSKIAKDFLVNAYPG